MINQGDHLERVAQAFSHKALVYDEFGVGHPNLQRMRQKVRDHVLSFIRPGESMLEMNAGTGSDAAFFAGLGYTVHATDVSPGMIASIQEKIAHSSLQERFSAELRSFTELDQLEGAPYDYVFSNLGGLNCTADLGMIAKQMSQLLRPGGRLTWVVMPRVCPWELAAVLKGDIRTAFRRLKPAGTVANVEGVQFIVHYYSPRQVRRYLGTEFRLLRVEGLSIFTPPADHKDFALRYPRLFRWLAALDDRFSEAPVLRNCGDFFILSAEYCP